VSGLSPGPVSERLTQWAAGDEEALRALVPLIYGELRRQARRYLRKERADHTLQTTALVHEAYLRLRKQGPIQFQNREHFFAIAAQLMRQILVDYARQQSATKRNRACKLTLDEAVLTGKKARMDLIALDDALNDLARLDPRQSQIVELRFFGGLSVAEISRVLGISPATVSRDWTSARLWLHHEMRSAPNA